MKVPYGEGGARGLLARGIQAPGPDAAKAVAVGEEIKQLAVGAPGRFHLLAAAIRDRDPLLARHGKSAIDGHHEDLRGGVFGTRVECHPLAVGRETAVGEYAVARTLGDGDAGLAFD